MTLGQRIQRHRAALGLSQEGLGDRLGVSRQAVSKWEADGAVPDTDKLIALSKLFGVSLNELLQVEGPSKPEEGEERSGLEAEKEKRAAPQANLKLHTTLLCVAAIILAVSSLISAMNVGALREELASLNSRVTQLEEAARSTELDLGAPLVANFDFQARRDDSSNVHFQFDLLPRRLSEELTVTFTVSDHYARSKTVEGTRKEGGHYTASFGMEASDPITVTAVFSDGEREYAQGLVRITSLWFDGYSYETLWEEE